MSRLVLRPFGQQHAAPVEIVGFSRGSFRTTDGRKVWIHPDGTVRIVPDDYEPVHPGCASRCTKQSGQVAAWG